jgi:hypothetical protein
MELLNIFQKVVKKLLILKMELFKHLMLIKLKNVEIKMGKRLFNYIYFSKYIYYY